MLHLRVPIKAGTSYGTIEYANPLQKSRSDYYQSTLHSVYSSASEDRAVNVPFTIKIQDSGYIAGITSEEIDINLSIREYCKKIATLLSGTSSQRSARTCNTLLKSYVSNVPTGMFDDDANDEDIDTRYFTANLPKSTYLYCNLKAPLHALGYADNQIRYISNLSAYPDIPKELIETAAAMGAYSDINSIYIVDDNINSASNPLPAADGHIKWLDEDKFEDVYFPARRANRYIESDAIPHPRFRVRRSGLSVVLSDVEQEMNIAIGDDKKTLLQKLAKTEKWVDAATLAKVEMASAQKPFDKSQLNPKRGETHAEAKVRYWREAIVTALSNVTVSASEPEIIVPSEYYGVHMVANELLIPLTTLAENDEKFYVRIAAESCMISFIAFLVAKIDARLQTAEGALKVSLSQQRQKFSEQSADRFVEKNNLIAMYTQEIEIRKKQFENLTPDDVVGENDEISLFLEGLTGTCDEAAKNVFDAELNSLIDTSRALNENDIIALNDRLHTMALASGDTIADAEDSVTRATDSSAAITKLWNDQVLAYNKFVLEAPIKVPAITLDDIEVEVKAAEEVQASANGIRNGMKTSASILKRNMDSLRCKTFNYSEFVQMASQSPEKYGGDERVKQQLLDQFNVLNGYNKDIVKALSVMGQSITAINKEIADSKSKVSGIAEIVTRLNSVYNVKNANRKIAYPAVMSTDINELTKIRTVILPDNSSSVAESETVPVIDPQPPILSGDQQSGTQQQQGSGKSKTDQPSKPPTPPPPPPPPLTDGVESGRAPTPQGDQDTPSDEGDEEDDDEDDRDDPNFVGRTKYSIGFVHFQNDPYVINSVIEISKATTAADVNEKFASLLRDPLLVSNLLNMAFQPRFFEVTENPKRYGLKSIKDLPLNNSYLQVDVKTRRNANLLRLGSIADSNFKITVYANIPYQKYSDNFDVVDPFENDFKKHYPLMLGPVNAGPFNAYSSVIGECTTMALLEREGRCRNPVDILMRSAERERYTINFYSAQNLEPTVFERDYVLYFHFNIEDV